MNSISNSDIIDLVDEILIFVFTIKLITFKMTLIIATIEVNKYRLSIVNVEPI